MQSCFIRKRNKNILSRLTLLTKIAVIYGSKEGLWVCGAGPAAGDGQEEGQGEEEAEGQAGHALAAGSGRARAVMGSTWCTKRAPTPWKAFELSGDSSD